MDEKTAKALDAMRRAVAKSQGLDESEVEMTIHYRTEEVPDYFYDIEELECEFCGESDPEKCPHFGELLGSECKCGHKYDFHLNAGERNFCAGGNSLNDEIGCKCQGFKERSDAD